MSDNIRGPIYPDILSALKIGSQYGSWYFLVASGFGILTQILLPQLLKQKQWFYVIYAVLLALMGVGCLVQLVAMSKLNSGFSLLLAGSALFGIGMGGSSVVHGLLLRRAVPPQSLSRAFSLLHAVYGAGAMASPLLVFTLRRNGYSWTSALWLCVFICVALLVLLALLRKHLPLQDSTPVESPLTQKSLLARPLDRNIKIISLIIAGLAFSVATEILISSRLVLYLREEIKITASMAEFILAGFFGCLLLGRLFSAWKMTGLKYLVWVPRLNGLAFVAVTAGLVLDSFVICFAGFFLGPIFPLSLVELNHRDTHNFPKISSYLFAIVGLSVFGMHGLFGAVAMQFGLQAGMSLAPIFLVLSNICFYFAHRID